MKQIWKFRLEIQTQQNVSMPIGAKILCVQMQYGFPCLWAIVDTSRATGLEDRLIILRGTGHPLTGDEGEYIGTVQASDGRLVWHIFEGENRD